MQTFITPLIHLTLRETPPPPSTQDHAIFYNNGCQAKCILLKWSVVWLVNLVFLNLVLLLLDLVVA